MNADVKLSEYDVILVNTSAGKDSQAMLDFVVRQAEAEGVKDRILCVHADLGRVEWKGTRDLAQEQCNFYGVPLVVVRREKGDLLDQVEQRGMWPDNKNRYCTSDQKRDQVAKVFTQIAAKYPGRQVKILNCMGLRAEESPARAKKVVLQQNKRASNGRKLVMDWLPIHGWSTEEVWAAIRKSGCPHHYAYDLGMPRLSCVFCIFAPWDALLVAGKANPELLGEYVRMEEKIGHTFRNNFKIADVQAALARGEQPKKLCSWCM